MVTLYSMLTGIKEREIETDRGRTSHGAWKKRRGREHEKKRQREISF